MPTTGPCELCDRERPLDADGLCVRCRAMSAGLRDAPLPPARCELCDRPAWADGLCRHCTTEMQRLDEALCGSLPTDALWPEGLDALQAAVLTASPRLAAGFRGAP